MSDNSNETEVVLMDSGQAIASYTGAEIDMQISTAKKYPRSLKQFKHGLMELATLDQETAESCYYNLPPRGTNGPIKGPSIRFAEFVAHNWGNLRYGSSILGTDATHVTVEGFAFDLEKNTAARVQVKRRITTKNGRRYSDDMITMTANAASAIAVRNAIFKVVPASLCKEAYEAALQTARGDVATLTQRRDAAIEWFSKAGATEAQLMSILGRAGKDEITLDDLVTLRGYKNAIQDGDTTIKNILLMAGVEKPESSLNERLQKKDGDNSMSKAGTHPTVKENPDGSVSVSKKGDAEDDPLPEPDWTEIAKEANEKLKARTTSGK